MREYVLGRSRNDVRVRLANAIRVLHGKDAGQRLEIDACRDAAQLLEPLLEELLDGACMSDVVKATEPLHHRF